MTQKMSAATSVFSVESSIPSPINRNQIHKAIENKVVPKLELISSHGGTADIFRATFPTGEVIACKESKNPSFNQMIDNEAVVLKKLKDNGLGKIAPEYYGKQNEGEKIRVYMEYLDGFTDLTRLTGSEKELSRLETIQVWNTITSYLRNAQAKGITHLDFGTSNIMVKREKDGIKVKIIDWAMASPSSDDRQMLEGSRQFIKLIDKDLGFSVLTESDRESLQRIFKKDYIVPAHCWSDISRLLKTAETRYIEGEFESSFGLSSQEQDAVKAITLGSDKPSAFLSKEFLKTIFENQMKSKDYSEFIKLGESYEGVAPLAILGTEERLNTIAELGKAIQYMLKKGYALPDISFDRLILNRDFTNSYPKNPISIGSYKGITKTNRNMEDHMLHSFKETVLGIASLDGSGNFPPHLYSWIRAVQKGGYDRGSRKTVYADLIEAVRRDKSGSDAPVFEGETFDMIYGDEEKEIQKLVALKSNAKPRLLLNIGNQLREIHRMNFYKGQSLRQLRFDIEEEVKGDPQLVFNDDDPPNPIAATPYARNPEEIKGKDLRDLADLSLFLFENSSKIPTRMIEWIWRVRSNHFESAESAWTSLLGKDSYFKVAA